jgi:hypothetical protein
VTYEEALSALAAAEANMKQAEVDGDRDEWRWAYEAAGRAKYALRQFMRVDT